MLIFKFRFYRNIVKLIIKYYVVLKVGIDRKFIKEYSLNFKNN